MGALIGILGHAAQNTSCGFPVPHSFRTPRCVYIMHREADPVFQNSAQGWPPCSSGCPRSDSV
eukprot:4263230-Prymnesium_polylepis.1